MVITFTDARADKEIVADVITVVRRRLPEGAFGKDDANTGEGTPCDRRTRRRSRTRSLGSFRLRVPGLSDSVPVTKESRRGVESSKQANLHSPIAVS